MKFVFIDDNTDLGEVMGLIASMKSSECIYFASPLDDLEYLSTNKIDFIITDMNMPFCSGDKLIKKLRDLKNDTPIIVSSGADLDSDKFLTEYGVLKFIDKTELVKVFDDIVALVIQSQKHKIINSELGKEFEKILIGID